MTLKLFPLNSTVYTILESISFWHDHEVLLHDFIASQAHSVSQQISFIILNQEQAETVSETEFQKQIYRNLIFWHQQNYRFYDVADTWRYYHA